VPRSRLSWMSILASPSACTAKCRSREGMDHSSLTENRRKRAAREFPGRLVEAGWKVIRVLL
jgi:hypothetical protein